MFCDAGPDVRWVGNEKGIAGDPSWATLNRDDFAPGEADEARLNRGDRPGTHWLPAECDVSIRPGWFYHASEDGKVKTPRELLDLYYQSVGRGASFLLNVPPDRRGRLHENDERSLRGFEAAPRRHLRAWTSRTAPGRAPATCGAATRASPRANVLDGRARHLLGDRRRRHGPGAGPRPGPARDLQRREPARAPAPGPARRGLGPRRRGRRPAGASSPEERPSAPAGCGAGTR